MHKALCCTCSLKFPPSLFSTFVSVLWCNLTTVAVFLNLSIIFGCSIIFTLLCLESAAYHTISFSLLLSIFFLFISCLWPPPVCALLLLQNICLLDQLLPYPLTSFNSSCACDWLLYKIFFVIFCLFSTPRFIGIVVCFQQPKTNSPPTLHIQLSLGSMGFACWLFGRSGGLVVQSFLILSNFSACPRAALKFEYQSSVKESESEKKLVQIILVLLWREVQYGAVSPLMWTWTQRT